MARSSTLRFSAFCCLIGCSGVGYLLYVDRQTTVAIHMVELQSTLPIPIPGLLALLSVLLTVWSINTTPVGTRSTQRKATAPSAVQARQSSTPESTHPPPLVDANRPLTKSKTSPQDTWWAQMRRSCNAITLPAGARIVLEPTRPCPIVLHLANAPPERCKRAISAVSAWFASFSIPPRFRVVFDHCPEGASPRHHMVSGAIASEIDRGGFKVISDRDSVDVLFFHPSPRWKKPQSTG